MDLFAKLSLIACETLQDLVAPEFKLTRSVGEIENGIGYWKGTSLATVSAPRPGAGTERPAMSLRQDKLKTSKKRSQYSRHVDVGVKARIPRIGARISRTALTFIHDDVYTSSLSFYELGTVSVWCLTIKQTMRLTTARVVVARRDISVGS